MVWGSCYKPFKRYSELKLTGGTAIIFRQQKFSGRTTSARRRIRKIFSGGNFLPWLPIELVLHNFCSECFSWYEPSDFFTERNHRPQPENFCKRTFSRKSSTGGSLQAGKLNLLCWSLAASFSPAGFAFFPFATSVTDSEGSLSRFRYPGGKWRAGGQAGACQGAGRRTAKKS